MEKEIIELVLQDEFLFPLWLSKQDKDRKFNGQNGGNCPYSTFLRELFGIDVVVGVNMIFGYSEIVFPKKIRKIIGKYFDLHYLSPKKALEIYNKEFK
jgi:hypothetical protein